MSGTALQMWREGGSGALFRGIVPRTQRVTFAVFILSEAKERLTHLYLQLAPQKQEGGVHTSPSVQASRRVAHMEQGQSS